jgi:tetratricopeptide (TPR) repeat protein
MSSTRARPDLQGPVRVGPFELLAPLGQGAMGAVWRASHAESGVEVAVKRISAQALQDEALRRAFRREVQATAGLDHPSVVLVLDQGEDEARQPWLAMELASAGTLATARPADWEGAREALGAVLEALAHAHARGVLHRDVKASNVLVGGTRSRYVLADFGLALPLEEDPSGERPAGTPTHVAPEQIRGGRLGPWTDLYALGCLAYELVCGAPPFLGSSRELLRAHLTQPAPAPRPTFEVPPGFAAWVLKLLRKDPLSRYDRAADALAALQDPPAAPSSDWRERAVPAPPLLQRAGLGLFGLRPVPLAGRERQRAQLWDLLGEARAGELRVALLTGVAGIGKSRLARWLCERAHELGLASVLRGRPQQRPVSVLSSMLSQHLQQEPTTLDRLAPEEAQALSRWLEGGSPAPRERHRMVRAVLGACRPGRVPVLWLDDADEEGLALADALLADPVPALLLLTRHTDAPALGVRPEVTRLELGPLPEQDHSALVRGLLGSGGELAGQLASRTAGHPLFAIQLVGDWAQRGALLPCEEGFRLAPEAPAQAPESLLAVWAERVAHLVSGRPPADRLALELASALGHTVDSREWAEVCRACEVQPSGDLVEAMLRAGLARREEGEAWSFVHGLLRESLMREAQAEGRLEGHHRACAAVVGAGEPERRARHLVGAGELQQALAPLLEAAYRRLRSADFAAADALLAERERLLWRAKAAPDSPSFLEGGLARSDSERLQGRFERALEHATRVHELAERGGWGVLAARGLVLAASACTQQGDLPAGLERIERALRLLEGQDRPPGRDLGRAQLIRTALLRRLGRLELAGQAARASREAYLAAPDMVGAADAEFQLGQIALAQDRSEEGLAHYRLAAERYREGGVRHGLAAVELQLGIVCGMAGDWEEAEAHLQAAGRLFEALGAVDALHAAAGLVWVSYRRGQLEPARDRAERALRHVQARELHTLLGGLHALSAAIAAALGDWPSLRAHLQAASSASLGAEPLTAQALEEASARATEAGLPEEAALAAQLAARCRPAH